MQLNINDYKKHKIYYYEKDELTNLAKDIIDGKKIENLQVYRKTERAYVRKIRYNNEVFVLKESKTEKKFPKNIISLLTKGEALSTLINVAKLRQNNIQIFKPILVIQKRKFGFIKKSFLLSEYISDIEARDEKYFPDVIKVIQSLHKQNIAHGDAKLDNFLVDKKDRVIAIDTRAKKMSLTPIRKYYDYFNIKYDIKNTDDFMMMDKGFWYHISDFIINFKRTKFYETIRKLRKRKYKKDNEYIDIE